MSSEANVRLALKELNIDETKQMVKEKTTKKNLRPDAGSEESSKPAAKKRKKKVIMRMGKEYVEYMEKHPPRQPLKPVRIDDWFVSDLQDSIIAQQKAALEAHHSIIKEYKEHGYVDREVEVTNDDEEEL